MPIPIERAKSDVNRQRLKAFNDEAREIGIFGSPSFVVGGETLWGDDRLEGAPAWARRVGSHRSVESGRCRFDAVGDQGVLNR
jgi:hypothetical protein